VNIFHILELKAVYIVSRSRPLLQAVLMRRAVGGFSQPVVRKLKA
jgi:hypothetical protein